jgi:hypothetical protein
MHCVLLSYLLLSTMQKYPSCHENLTLCFLCTDEPQVDVKNIKLLSAAIDMQKMDTHALLSSYKTLHTAATNVKVLRSL